MRIIYALLSAIVLIVFSYSNVYAGDNQKKVDVCHLPPGNPENANWITVGIPSAVAHANNHGDYILSGNDRTCSVGVGECATSGTLLCTSAGLLCDAEPGIPPEETESSCDDGLDNDCDGATDNDDSDCGVQITVAGEAYGHHGACSGWNGCGDAATCALWACEVNGYTDLVSHGEDRPCTEFDVCHLFYYRGFVEWNWGNWCPVQGVTDIVCR